LRLSEIIKRPLYDVVNVIKDGDKWILEGPGFVLEMVSQDARVREKLGDNIEYRVKSSRKKSSDDEAPDFLIRTGILYGEDLSFDMTPSTYLVSSNNERAYTKSMETLKGKSLSLLVYGVPGVGKTHLLHAVGWFALKKLRYNVAFFTSSSLIELIHSSFADGRTDRVREVLSSVDLFLIDDFQGFDRKKLESCIDFVFTIVDRLILRGKRVIVSSDVKSSLWKYIPERLRQRLTLAGSVSIQPPDGQFARLMLEREAERAGKAVSEEALNLIEKFQFDSVRKLKSVVVLLMARAKGIIDRDDVLYAIYEVMGEEGFPSEVEESINLAWRRVIEDLFDPFEAEAILRGEKLRGDAGKRLQLVRAAFVALLKDMGLSNSYISRFFGVSKSALYKWLLKDKDSVEDLSYNAMKAKIRETIRVWWKR